ncbi:unnamed protein product [Boreogadus saida]
MLKQLDDSMANMQVNNRPLKVGHTLTITGIPKTGDGRFQFNILSGSDIAFHMGVRFDETIVAYNTCQAGVWGAEVHQGGFPLPKPKTLKVVSLGLSSKSSGLPVSRSFLVLLSDGSEVHFPNRLGKCEYLDFSFDEGVLIRSFEIN